MCSNTFTTTQPKKHSASAPCATCSGMIMMMIMGLIRASVWRKNAASGKRASSLHGAKGYCTKRRARISGQLDGCRLAAVSGASAAAGGSWACAFTDAATAMKCCARLQTIHANANHSIAFWLWILLNSNKISRLQRLLAVLERNIVMLWHDVCLAVHSAVIGTTRQSKEMCFIC